MAERGYDAVILRNNSDLRWLTGAERTIDDEVAHTAFVTADGLWLHTDSRYFGTFQSRLGADTPWKLDMDIVAPAWWAAQRIRETRSRVVAVEDTCDWPFLMRWARSALRRLWPSSRRAFTVTSPTCAS